MKKLQTALILMMSLIFSSCDNTDEPQASNSITIEFENVIGEESLTIGDKLYQRDGASFNISAFKYYISNVVLLNESGDVIYEEEGSYHLIAQSQSESNLSFTLKDVPDLQVASLSFSIGVDPIANKSIDNEGDLDPSNEMAWNWDTGYKFLLLEGELIPQSGERRGLVFHIGSDENYKTLNFPLNIDLSGSEEAKITFEADILGLFGSPNYISFNEVNVAMGGEEAKLIADNYSINLFKLKN